jgi:hypothetical protein
MYADDTNLFISGPDQKRLIKQGNQDLKSVFSWLCTNRLSLNADKTKFMMFQTGRKPAANNPVSDLIINKQSIEKVNEIRFLGLTLDENLSWKSHMSSIIKKLRMILGATRKIRPNLNMNALLFLYHCMIESQVRYCITVWKHGNLKLQNQIQRLCKKFISMACGKWCDDDKRPMHNILSVNDLFQLEVSSIMYSYHNNSLPCCFTDMFSTFSSIHSINTRNKYNFQLPPCRKSIASQSIRITGPNVWNKLPNSIKAINKKSMFTRKIKKCL